MIERLVNGRRHYAWLIVGVTFVTLITTAGFRATPGVLIVPLQNHFGWSRGSISLAVSLGLLMYGLSAPFSAALMDRFGVRRVMLVALATIAVGSSLTTVMTAPWQLDLLWGVVVGSATGAVAVPLAATVATHLLPAAVDHRMAEVAGASLLALMGIFDVIGTTVSGFLTDRMDPRKLLAWYYGLRGLAVIALPYAFGSTAALVAFAVFYGLDWVATVPPTAALTADRFGRERVGIVFGWIFASHQFGAAFAAWAAGASRGWLGSYTVAFVSAGALCLVAAGLSLRVTRPEPTLAAAPAPA